MENNRLTAARKILFAHNYRRIREHLISQADIDRKRLLLEWWAGTRGVIILQSEEGEEGVQTYINWGHGHTMDELKAAVAPIVPQHLADLNRSESDTGLFSGIIPMGAKDTTPEQQAALDAILPDDDAAALYTHDGFCPSCKNRRSRATKDGTTFAPGSVCPYCGHVEPEDDDVHAQ